MDIQENRFRFFFNQIVKGYSAAKLDKKNIYIKHLTPIEQGEIDGEYLYFYNKGASRGLQTEETKLSLIKKQNLWTDEKDKDIENKRSYLIGLQK